MSVNGKAFDTASKRWEGLGPYYAMFPIQFAESVIREYTAPGDCVLDPFAGRGTSVFSAACLGRVGIGVEISPVGWVYAKTKLAPAPKEMVEARLLQIATAAQDFKHEANRLPLFYKKCYSPGVRRFLLAARSRLDWRRSSCDRTLMALLLVYLHGKYGQALSNQMRQTKAMSPPYAIRWWADHGYQAPDIDVVYFVRQRLQWRYAHGVVESADSQVYLGNSMSVLPRISDRVKSGDVPRARLLLTSPPYYGVTNYHYDQWLRLWLLGFESSAYVSRGPYKGRFTDVLKYQHMLDAVFCRAAKLLSRDATVFIRTGQQAVTRQATLDAATKAFPSAYIREIDQPFLRPTQTHLFGDRAPKAGEVDLVLQLRRTSSRRIGRTA